MLQPGSVTHAFNYGQKYIELPIVSRSGATLNLRAPSDYNLLPKGYYMLFVLTPSGENAAGPLIPSPGKFIQRV